MLILSWSFSSETSVAVSTSVSTWTSAPGTSSCGMARTYGVTALVGVHSGPNMLLRVGSALGGTSVFTWSDGGSDRRTVTIESWPSLSKLRRSFGTTMSAMIGEEATGDAGSSSAVSTSSLAGNEAVLRGLEGMSTTGACVGEAVFGLRHGEEGVESAGTMIVVVVGVTVFGETGSSVTVWLAVWASIVVAGCEECLCLG